LDQWNFKAQVVSFVVGGGVMWKRGNGAWQAAARLFPDDAFGPFVFLWIYVVFAVAGNCGFASLCSFNRSQEGSDRNTTPTTTKILDWA
jgi:hypothetical protein